MSHTGNCSPLKHLIVANHSIRGQQSPLSDCANALSDLDIFRPHMTSRSFSNDAERLLSTKTGDFKGI